MSCAQQVVVKGTHDSFSLQQKPVLKRAIWQWQQADSAPVLHCKNTFLPTQGRQHKEQNRRTQEASWYRHWNKHLGTGSRAGNRAKAKSEAQGRHWYNKVGREIMPLTGTGRQ